MEENKGEKEKEIEGEGGGGIAHYWQGVVPDVLPFTLGMYRVSRAAGQGNREVFLQRFQFSP